MTELTPKEQKAYNAGLEAAARFLELHITEGYEFDMRLRLEVVTGHSKANDALADAIRLLTLR